MLLKRHYDIPADWEPERNGEGTLRNPLPVQGLTLVHTGVHAEQNFSRRLVDAGISEGWVSLSKGQLIVHTAQEDLRYTILRMPGIFCCHCGDKLPEDPTGATGRAHVALQHAGVLSPDTSAPAGYVHTQQYTCVLAEDQHARWMRPPGATVSHWRKG